MIKHLQGLLLLFISTLCCAQTTPTPDQLWGPLFTQVQLTRALGDNKTFVDAVPKFTSQNIMSKYSALPLKDSASLHNFVISNFILPAQVNTKSTTARIDLRTHLVTQWDLLTRKADTKTANSSLLPLPFPYVVPGGRFREIYYWDSYFTMLGLAASNRYDLIENMLNNFAYLINTFGHIPNGNRNYYLSRSQPPYFTLMVQLLVQKKGRAVYKKYLPALQKEYAFWMDGHAAIKNGEAFRRVVKMQDGSILNRYHDDSTIPRQESYFEDVQTGLLYAHKDGDVYRHLRSAAESGWDFSSRWLTDTSHLATIETTNIIPVDLNCLLYAYEEVLAEAFASQKQIQKAKDFEQKAVNRKQAINLYCWDENQQFYFDYNIKSATTTGKLSLAGVMPLFAKLASVHQADAVKKIVVEQFLKAGGVVTTPYHTHQQWDAPNGWAPLQYITIKGLLNYDYHDPATTIAQRWMHVNEQTYMATGKILEKYNVEDISTKSGGGEYPTQDGFGWTNGVYLELYQLFKK